MPHRFSRSGFIWLTVLSVGTVLSLFGAVLGIIRYGELEAQRENDRVEFDKGSCERGNTFRKSVVGIANAGAQLDRDIIDELVRNPDTQSEIDKRLQPAYDRFQALVDEIEFTDCDAALEGQSVGRVGFRVPFIEALASN